MAHTFKILINNDLSSTLKKVEKAIIENGGKFKGDMDKGEFSGKIKGEYVVLSKDKVEITITRKPFAVPGRKIESAIREYFT
ncbi:MAG: hypothetical protein KZQ83_05410 [gamma proteobacterium symbiont of Taylorina sp.]|nr:hypothetical protein [gamma proteobacterium symbiont of Taylorina sp.]